MNAFADGVNFYLYKHPDVKPDLLNHFQSWYPLLWTDGSIGAINTAGISVNELKSIYSEESLSATTRKIRMKKYLPVKRFCILSKNY
jgi:hypothetical protein